MQGHANRLLPNATHCDTSVAHSYGRQHRVSPFVALPTHEEAPSTYVFAVASLSDLTPEGR